jgi:hypothetical protein
MPTRIDFIVIKSLPFAKGKFAPAGIFYYFKRMKNSNCPGSIYSAG